MLSIAATEMKGQSPHPTVCPTQTFVACPSIPFVPGTPFTTVSYPLWGCPITVFWCYRFCDGYPEIYVTKIEFDVSDPMCDLNTLNPLVMDTEIVNRIIELFGGTIFSQHIYPCGGEMPTEGIWKYSTGACRALQRPPGQNAYLEQCGEATCVRLFLICIDENRQIQNFPNGTNYYWGGCDPEAYQASSWNDMWNYMLGNVGFCVSYCPN